MSFNANNKAIETKLVEKMGIEQPAGHPFCNTHTALAMTASGFYIMDLSSIVAPCFSGYHYCTTSFNGVSEIHDDEDLWQWTRLEIRLNAFRQPIIPQK